MAIRVELELDDGSFTTRMLHAGETVRQFQNNVGQGMTSVRQLNETSRDFLGTLRDVTVVFGLAGAAIANVKNLMTGWAGQIVNVNAEMERMRALLAGMSQAADPIRDATRQIEYLRESAKQAPYSLAALTNTFVKMKATGIDPMAGSMRSLVDAVAAAGGTEDQLGRASLAISQMAGKGVIQMEELRQQLGEAVPRATELLARALGTTYAQLAQNIATGTVQAKPALEALRLELERTFGGAAQAQMNTFMGQLSQTRTNLQNFALKVGQTGYFDAVKKQLQDFNRMLATPQASAFAQSLGEALMKAIQVFRDIIGVVIEFKSELILVAEVMAAAFAGRAAIAGIQGMIGVIERLATSVTLARAQFAALQTQAAVAPAMNALGFIPLTAQANAFGAAIRGVGTVVGALSIGVSGLAPWLPLIGGAVMAAATYFGWFSDRARDAWENLEKYGAATRKQVLDAQPFLKAQREKLELLEAELAQQEKMVGSRAGTTALFGGLFGGKSLREQIVEERRKLFEMEKQFSKFGAEAEEKEGARASEAVLAELQKRADVIQKAYDQEFTVFSKSYEERRNAAIKGGKSITDIDKAYQDETRARQLKFYDDQIRELEDYWNSVITTASGATGQIDAAERASLEATQSVITKRIAQFRQSADALRQLQQGVPMSEKAANEARLFEKANTALEKMKAKLAGNQAELAGASNEAAKLRYELEEMQKYGPLDNQKIAETVARLQEVSALVEQTQKAIDGRTDFERDAANLKRRLQEQLFEAQTRGMADVDKLKLKYKNLLETDFGAGQSPMQRTIDGVRTALVGAGQESVRAANAMRNSIFGGTMLSNAQTFLATVRDIAGTFGIIAGHAGGVNLSGLRGLPGGGGSVSLIPGTYLDRLIHKESGGDSNAAARTSSAVGLGQFTAGTWMSFIKDRYSDLLSGSSRSEILELRKDASMMKEAIMWYAEKNAAHLERNSVAATDANLYLAHFLGPDGAVKALTADLSTSLAAILPDAVRANSFLEGKNVAWLQDWARSFMGNGATARSGVQPPIQPVASTDPNDPKTAIPAATASNQETIRQLEDLTRELNKVLGKNALADDVERVKREIAEAREQADGLGKNYSAVVKSIKEGKVVAGDRDPNSDQYKELIALAKEWDKADEQARKNKQFREQLERSAGSSKQRMEDLKLREDELRRRERNRGGFEFSDSYYRERAQRERENDRINEGLNSGAFNAAEQAQAKQVLEENARFIASLRDRELRETVLTEQQKTDEIKKSLMTVEQARQATYEAEIRRLESMLQIEGLTAEQRVQIEQMVQDKKRAMAQQVSASGPLAKQMKEWSDFGGNMEKAMTGWLDGAADALASFITTGKADFKALAQSIISDMTKIALKAMMGNMFGGSKGQGSGLKGMARPGASGAGKMASGGKGIPGFHNGGIIGGTPTFTRDIGKAFVGSLPKFHTGGIVGHDEVPALLKRKEGVFTPEQMKALGGGIGQQVVQQNVSVSVQGGASGNPQADEKLADMIAKRAKEELRGMVGQEIRQQMRPGGMLGR